MNLQQFFKGLLMALISILVVAFSQSPVDYGLLIATAIATILAYTGKNLIGFISDSDPGKWTIVNTISAGLVALSTAITESIALIVIDHKFIFAVFWKVIASATLTYIAGTLFTPPTKQAKKLFK
jgi:hypothetical protein